LVPCALSAQPVSEFNRRLGACGAQADRQKRLLCFEQLARAAIDELERRQAPSGSAAANPPDPMSQDPDGRYSALIAQAKARISQDFKDPRSAQWRGIIVTNRNSNRLVVCGEVNATNSYGGYVGFKRFLTDLTDVSTAIEDDKEGGIVRALWDLQCSKIVYVQN
jgi:hypothetical protein